MAHLWLWFVAAVWPNLVASMIWGTPAGVAFAWHHRRLKRHHTEEIRKLRIHLLGAMADERQRQTGSETT